MDLNKLIQFHEKFETKTSFTIVLGTKFASLTDMFQEQCRLLTTLKEDIRNSKAAMEKAEQYQTDILADFVKKAVFQRFAIPISVSILHTHSLSLFLCRSSYPALEFYL